MKYILLYVIVETRPVWNSFRHNLVDFIYICTTLNKQNSFVQRSTQSFFETHETQDVSSDAYCFVFVFYLLCLVRKDDRCSSSIRISRSRRMLIVSQERWSELIGWGLASQLMYSLHRLKIHRSQIRQVNIQERTETYCSILYLSSPPY